MGAGLLVAVIGRGGDGEGFGVMGEGIGVLAGEPGGFTETIVCMGFAVPLPDFAENRECLPVPVDRLGRLAPSL